MCTHACKHPSNTCSHSATNQDMESQKPLHTTVVLLNSNGKTSQGSVGVSITTLSLDAPPAPKVSKPRGGVSFGADWLSLLRPSVVNVGSNGTLKFSRSLNDVGQRMDSLCSGLHFIDRTCSEGELEVKPDPVQTANTDRRTQTLNSKPSQAPTQHTAHDHRHLVPSFTNNYKYMGGLSPDYCSPQPTPGIPPPPPPPSTHLHPPSSNLLRLFLPFSRSSTSASLQCSELGSYTSRLHIPKSSSAFLGGSELGVGVEDLMGDDEVFEMEQERTSHILPERPGAGLGTGGRIASLHAPLCFMDEDSDLDPCSSPVSEKNGPLSPYSLSGDCCRWVIVWSVHQPLCPEVVESVQCTPE